MVVVRSSLLTLAVLLSALVLLTKIGMPPDGCSSVYFEAWRYCRELIGRDRQSDGRLRLASHNLLQLSASTCVPHSQLQLLRSQLVISSIHTACQLGSVTLSGGSLVWAIHEVFGEYGLSP